MIEMNGDFAALSDVYRALAWAIGPTVVAIVIVALLRIRRWLRGDKRATDDIPRSAMGRFGGSLPAEITLLADAGTTRAAHETLGEKFLRPTWGLRLITFGLPLITYLIAVQVYDVEGVAFSQLDAGMLIFLAALMAYALLYLNIYELRYDSYRFAHRTWFFFYREYPWSDLLSIRDDGAYFYIMRGLSGSKTYVPKHLQGVDDFIAIAKLHIAANDRV